jgi:hypothetical protein
MKLINQLLLISLLATSFYACKKDMQQAVISPNPKIESYAASASQIALSDANSKKNVLTLKFAEPDYGLPVAATYTLQFDLPSDTTGAAAWGKAINFQLPVDSLQKSFTGADLNSIAATQLKMPVGTAGSLVVRLKSDIINLSTGTASGSIPSIYSVITLRLHHMRLLLYTLH